MKVEKLVKSKNVPDRWYVDLGGDTLRVDTGVVAELSLFTGRELDDDELERLRVAAARSGARERALRLLSSRQLSRKELIKRLTEKGETAESAEYAADLMERIGAINDAEYAGAIVRGYAKKGCGGARIKEELFWRGVPRELWDAALEELPEDSSATIDALLAKRLGAKYDDADIRRATAFLQRRGFGWGEIKEALRRYGEE